MRIQSIALLVAAIVLAGCTQQSERGGPGVKSTNGKSVTVETGGNSATAKTETTHSSEVVDKAQTFAINKPLIETNVQQGDSEDLVISIDRGSEFTQPVTLQFRPPQGVTITPAEGMIKADTKDVKVVIAAAADAPIGKHHIDVTAVPKSGKSVVTHLAIEVKKKG